MREPLTIESLGEQAAQLFMDANPGADLTAEVAKWEAVPNQISPLMGETQRDSINSFAWGYTKVLRDELARRRKSAT